ncbi:MAG: GIY-YIG nuclease family protein [Acidobacteriota bacterium]|nr:GIY-YIG nuclease family protein [Acidobacteriota bacterium]
MLRCDGKFLYTGITCDVARRLAEHAAGSPRGARFTRGFTCLELVYKACLGERSLALQAEARIKQMPRRRKEELVRKSPSVTELLELLQLQSGNGNNS